jgi:hypothetical protein
MILITWFDIGYATLNIILIFYSFKEYLSTRKRSFQLLGLGFACLLISDFLWVPTLFLSRMPAIYSYVRFGVYAVFTLLVLRALQLLSLPSSSGFK